MNSQASHNIDDTRSQASNMRTQNNTHIPSQRHLTQTQTRRTLQPSFLPSALNTQAQSQNLTQNNSEIGSVNPQLMIGSYSKDEIEADFRKFLINFEKIRTNDMGEETVKIYKEQMQAMRDSGNFFLMINGIDIYNTDKALYQKIVSWPGDLITIMDVVAQQVYIDVIGEHCETEEEQMQVLNEAGQLLVGIYNLKVQKKIRDLAPKDVNRLVSIKGIVIRCSNIFPEMKRAQFVCTQCGLMPPAADLNQGRVEEPQTCDQCRGKFTFQIKHNLCVFTDKQYIKIQETPESIPEGETPQSTTLVAYDQNVDNVRPGDRVESVGILRAQGVRPSQNKRTLKTVYQTFIDIISFGKNDETRFDMNVQDSNQQIFSQQQIERFQEIADSENVYDVLTKSFAPSIWENLDVKKGLLCQLFGGAQKNFEKTGKGRFRAEINTLLCGDPSVAKSQLLQYTHNLAPRGVYTSGKGSSAVGLTAYITRDPETKEIILESGALVLSDLGICCIDEFDKMDDNTRSILLEAMEQQTISVAKAGIVAQLNARTAVLAAANPIESKYNPKKSVIENINLSAPLMSRFDLIYILLDQASERQDTTLCNHIMSLYTDAQALKEHIKNMKLDSTSKKSKSGKKSNKNEMQIEDEDDQQNKMQLEQLTKEEFASYISYARTINPKLSEEASNQLQKEYVELRKQGQSRNVIVCTTRQLESAIRLSEAQARMRLRDIVEIEDVEEAFRLIKVSSQMAATDPETGLIDIDVITTGFSKAKKELIDKLQTGIINIMQGDNSYTTGFVSIERLLQQLGEYKPFQGTSLKDKDIEFALRDLIKGNQVQKFGNDRQFRSWSLQLQKNY